MSEISVSDWFARQRRQLPEPSDAAKRITDTLNSRLTFCPWSVGQWLAFKLDTGESDGVLYESKKDAVKHQLDETKCMFIIVRPDLTNAAEIEQVLAIHRKAYEAGFRVSDN